MKRWVVLLLLMAVSLAMPAMAAEGCYCEQPTPNQIGFDEATCTLPGYYVLECLDCGGEYRVEAKPALGHDYQYAMTNPALCESDGKEWYECTRCGDTQYQTIPKLGHQWSLAGSLNATCGKDGANYYECTRLGCGEEKTESIPATGEHDYQQVGVLTPTCGQKGAYYLQCTRCGDEETVERPATGEHDYQQVGVLTPTCGQKGAYYLQCTRCGDEETVERPATGEHDWVHTHTNRDDVECVAGGTAYYHCSVCMEQKNEPVNATGHNWQAVAATAATCQSAKVVTYKCSKCNDTKTETEGSKTDHSWVQTYYEPATCAADGYKSYKCGMCSETKTDVLPATEQCSWGEWKVTKEATEVATGTKERTCKTCGAKDTETIPKKGAKPTATEKPTDAPTQKPTDKPTNAPTQKPTDKPTDAPTQKPTDKPTNAPTQKPTDKPTNAPTQKPTDKPTNAPTQKPTDKPTNAPTQEPTDKPTNAPTQKPTDKPTNAPTQKPTDKPTNAPTQKPTNKPTKKPAAKVSSSFEAEEGTVQVFTTAGKVNLRSGPGKDHKYVDQVPKKNTCLGQLLDAQLDKHNVVWFQVEYDGRQCWITSQYAVAVPGEYCGIIRVPDGDLTELSNIYLQSFDEVAITLGLNENMDSDIREFTNGSVFVTGQHYIEHIVLTGSGYTVYGVKVGDNVTDAVRLLKQKLAPDSQSDEAYIFRIPCSPDSVSIDGEGFDGMLTITVDTNNQVTSITVKAGIPEAE